MAVDQQARTEIENLKTQFQTFLNTTKTIDQVSATNRKIFVQELGNTSVDINSDIDKTGLRCMGKKAGINDGNYFDGYLSTVANPTSDSDFSELGFSS